ncbi:MAG: FAD:protein FMN transferase [Clostridia bacterium]|nr:FAD:protein FMN transferase [Clostridia bacterium]
MIRRTVALVLALLLTVSCTYAEPALTRYTASFLSLFDTVTTMVGYAESKDAFSAAAEHFRSALERYHRLYDIYHTYPGMNNLKTVNDSAGVTPVQVDRAIIDLLLFCRDMYEVSGGAVDVTMGGVLSLWHTARAEGLEDPASACLPDAAQLTEAALHRGFEHVIIDEAAGTVYIDDPLVQLDVGAVAKGYAVEMICRDMPAGMLISVGGNVYATGANPDTGHPWGVGIQDPAGSMSEHLHILDVTHGAVVTSGVYQRYYVVDGRPYHHLIDPATLMPGALWQAVTVVCDDSGVADALSTALFLLPQENGQRLLEHFGAEAVWCSHDGTLLFSPGYAPMIRQ